MIPEAKAILLPNALVGRNDTSRPERSISEGSPSTTTMTSSKCVACWSTTTLLPRGPPDRFRIAVSVFVVAMFMAIMDTTIVNVALCPRSPGPVGLHPVAQADDEAGAPGRIRSRRGRRASKDAASRLAARPSRATEARHVRRGCAGLSQQDRRSVDHRTPNGSGRRQMRLGMSPRAISGQGD